MRSHRQARGFTLIELLVVVIIIATIVSIALMSMSLVGDDRELDTERQRLASLIEAAQDEATMQGREFGLELMTSTYRFVEFDAFTGQWSEIAYDEMFGLRQLPEGIEFELYVDDKRVILDANPKQFEDPEDTGMSISIDTYAPHVFIYASGESSAYEIRLRQAQLDQQLVMRGDILGDIEFGEDDE